MCGIAGWYRRGGRHVSRAAIAHQCDRMIHRGPDDHGYLVEGDFGFGMRRLSIIDIEGGHQPIRSPDGRYSIVCNGEIVNHPELRKELESGYPFRTRSDIETLLASYLRWGDDAWLRLEGMYAVAIWDKLSKKLTLARDPLGIKPLYFSEQQGGLAFASEIGALRTVPGFKFDLDEDGVDDFFCFGHTLPPRTIFRQVQPLEPGHVLHVGATGEPLIRRFWGARLTIEEGITEAEWVDRTRTELLRTVKDHQLSDVPVGVFASGGIDSGAIAAAMARTTAAPFKMFTAGFPGSRLDETSAATRLAQHLGCEHVVLPIHSQTASDVLPAVQASFDEPTAANSAIPLWHLSRAAAEHVKVVLCGEGGDELFLGYKRQRTAKRMARWRPFMTALGGAVDHLPELPIRKWNYIRQNVARFHHGAQLKNGYERFFASVAISSPELRARIYQPQFLLRSIQRGDAGARADAYFPLGHRQSLSDIEEFMLGDLTVHLPASLCQRLDRASMAHSLEARVPFLSHRFVDFALTIPSELKLRGNVGKYILRQAVEPWLPKGQLDQGKMGFQLPLADWFMGGFSDFAREAWSSSGVADSGILDARGVARLFDEHRRGTANHGRILYALAMFGCWWEAQGPQLAPKFQRSEVAVAAV